jgi:hypothetical protein
MSTVVFAFPTLSEVNAVLHRVKLRSPEGEELKLYEPAALIPDLPFCGVPATSWRPLEFQEAVRLAADAPLIALLPFGESLTARIRGGIAARARAEAIAWIDDISISDLMGCALVILDHWFTWSKGSEQFVTLRFNEPNQATVTYNAATNAHIGIHLDSWDGGPLRERQKSRVRLCVNVGVEPRSFLFSTVDVSEILRIGGADADAMKSGSLTPTDLARSALRMAGAGVYQVTVPPGWGYIAPTEILPHDATSMGMTFMDCSLQVIGDFRPLKRFFSANTFIALNGDQ